VDLVIRGSSASKRRSVAGIALGGCAVAGAATAVLLAGGGHASAPVPSGRDAPPTPLAAAPAPSIRTIAGAGGSRITCPHGAEPRITLTGAEFAPTLKGGTSFVSGRYGIRLHGTVDNETNVPVIVEAVGLTLGGHPWVAKPSVATRIPAQASAVLNVTGTYAATRPERVDLRAHLRWRWADPALAPCGSEGLVEDD